MMTDTRWQNWLHAAKERAASMEVVAPLASAAPRPRRRPTPAAAPAWFEGTRVVLQDPPNFIANWEARKARPTKLFRSFHGKEKAA